MNKHIFSFPVRCYKKYGVQRYRALWATAGILHCSLVHFVYGPHGLLSRAVSGPCLGDQTISRRLFELVFWLFFFLNSIDMVTNITQRPINFRRWTCSIALKTYPIGSLFYSPSRRDCFSLSSWLDLSLPISAGQKQNSLKESFPFIFLQYEILPTHE